MGQYYYNGQSNFFFNNYNSSQEQELLENLILESISIYGHNCYYIPRKLNNYDPLYTEDDGSSYENAFPLCIYIDSVNGFTGDQEFLSKFGVEIRNQIILSIPRRTFDSEVTKNNEQIRPNEGDVIYFPLNKRVFIIRYVDNYEMFYQLGKLYTWKCTCEVFEYSNEKFSTGITEIDKIQSSLSINMLDWIYKDELGDILLDEDGSYLIQEGKLMTDMVAGIENDEFQKESDQFIVFDEQNPFSEGTL